MHLSSINHAYQTIAILNMNLLSFVLILAYEVNNIIYRLKAQINIHAKNYHFILNHLYSMVLPFFVNQSKKVRQSNQQIVTSKIKT